MDELYSLENAQKFKWSSVSGDLNPERVSHLETYLVGNKILDAGCGGGAYVEFLAQKGLEVTGVDKYNQFLQLARDKGQKGTYVQSDITNLPFPNKTFDCTYCFDVLEHVDDRLALQELTRVTTNRIIIAVPKEDEIMNKFSLTFYHYQDKTHLRNYTETSLKELISSIQFSKFVIEPELAVPLESLVRELVDFNLEKVLASEIKLSNIKYLIKKLINFRNLNINYFNQQKHSFMLNKLFDEACYKKIYTSLVAIIDF